MNAILRAETAVQPTLWKSARKRKKKVKKPDIREVLARRNKQPESDLEVKFAELLRKHDIDFERHYRVSLCTVDFYVPRLNLLIEVNGCYWHCCRKCKVKDRGRKRASDRRRIAFLKSQGYQVREVWEHDIKSGNLAFLNRLRSRHAKSLRSSS